MDLLQSNLRTSIPMSTRLHIAFCAVPMLGHLIPLLPYAEELVARGHVVTIFHHHDHQHKIPDSCQTVGYDRWGDMYQTILSHYEIDRPDAFVYDFFAVDAADAADQLRVPAVGVFPNPRSINPWAASLSQQDSIGWKAWSVLMYGMEGLLARILWCVRTKTRWSRGLPMLPEQDVYPSPYMPRTMLGSMAPCIEFDNLPPAPLFHPLGPSLTTRYEAMPDELVNWMNAQTRPIVYVAFGTQYRYTEQSIRELQEQLLETQVAVLWSLPEKYQPALMGVVPSHWNLQSFVPQVAVLQSGKIHAFVSHCGSNSVGEALLAGVPMICSPGGADQPANASRLARAGVGILPAKKNQIGLAIRQLLVNYAVVEERSQALASELNKLDATKRGADVIEKSARTGHVALPSKGRWPVWPLIVCGALFPIFA